MLSQLVQQRMLVHGNYVLEALKKSSLHRQRLLSKYPSDSFLLKLSFPSLKLLFYNFHIRLYSISLSIQNTLVNLAKNSGFSAMAIANLLLSIGTVIVIVALEYWNNQHPCRKRNSTRICESFSK
jgi:hypothetical protein